jgi:lipopolysaccharide transport system ATP-binding protein
MIHSATSNDDELILDVNHVWKIYCRNLKRSMRYGVQDLGRELFGKGRDRTRSDLRPGEFCAVKDAHFQVRSGECVGMLGPNGAGKSSMLKMINGLVKPDSGSITIRGSVGAMIELGTGFNPVLSGRENVYINGSILGISKKEIDAKFEEVVEFAELGHVIDSPIMTYSTGMKMRLGFSIGANLRPKLLLIDEVLAVGDVGFRMKCFAHLRKLVDEGVCIILVTHAVGMLNRVATRSIVFNRGSVIHDGDLETGCVVYEETMGASDRVGNKGKSKTQASTTGVSISSVEVVDDKGNVNKEFETGQDVIVQVEVSAGSSARDLNLVAALWSPVHGRIASMSTASQSVEFGVAGDSSVAVTLRFENVPLLLGAYYFNLSLYGPVSTDFHHRVMGVGNFRIVGPPTCSLGRGIDGMVKIDHRWEIE